MTLHENLPRIEEERLQEIGTLTQPLCKPAAKYSERGRNGDTRHTTWDGGTQYLLTTHMTGTLSKSK